MNQLTNVREAAERLTNAKVSGINYYDIYHHQDDGDCRLLADWALKFLDPSPITPEALVERGFARLEAWGSGKYIYERIMESTDETGTVLNYCFEHGMSLDGAPMQQITTLAQLDHLIFALTPASGGEKCS